MKRIFLLTALLCLSSCGGPDDGPPGDGQYTKRLGNLDSDFEILEIGIEAKNLAGNRLLNYATVDADQGKVTVMRIASKDFQRPSWATPLCSSEINLTVNQMNLIKNQVSKVGLCSLYIIEQWACSYIQLSPEINFSVGNSVTEFNFPPCGGGNFDGDCRHSFIR